MYLLSIDGASRTGYSIFKINKKRIELVQYGVIQLDKTKKDYERILEMGKFLDELLNEYKIDLVVFEEVYGRFYEALKFLVKLQFFLQSYCFQKGVPFAEPVKVSDWKGSIEKKATKKKASVPATGIKGLFGVDKVDKEESIRLVQDLLKVNEIDDNMSDSILMGIYYIKEILKNMTSINYKQTRRQDYGKQSKSNSKSAKTNGSGKRKNANTKI